MKCYLMTWDRSTRGGVGLASKDLTRALDRIDEVANWRATTGCILIVSDEKLESLFNQIRREVGDAKFLLVPVHIDDVDGLTDEQTWEFIKVPKPVSSI